MNLAHEETSGLEVAASRHRVAGARHRNRHPPRVQKHPYKLARDGRWGEIAQEDEIAPVVHHWRKGLTEDSSPRRWRARVRNGPDRPSGPLSGIEAREATDDDRLRGTTRLAG